MSMSPTAASAPFTAEPAVSVLFTHDTWYGNAPVPDAQQHLHGVAV